MTMWYAVYDTLTGELRSIGTALADPLPADMKSKSVGAEYPIGAWNLKSLQFDRPLTSRVTTVQFFMDRFTMSEEIAIRQRALVDASMITFLARLDRAGYVDLDHPDIAAGVSYCVSIGAITAVRGVEIIDG